LAEFPSGNVRDASGKLINTANDGIEYLDEGIRSTPQPFNGAANGGAKLLSQYSRFPRIATKFAEHGKEWTSTGIEAYYKRAISLADNKVGGNVLGFTSKEGWVFRMNSRTGEFLTVRPDGTIATFFRRVSDPAKYWAEQMRKYGH